MSMDKKRLCKCCTTGWLLCLVGGISIPIITFIIKKQVEKTVVIKEGGVLYELWKDVPIPIYMQFYIFNLTNPEEVLNGKKPYVVQKGPYTYLEKREKFNITFNANGTVSYRQKRIFLFDRDKSVGNETDIFITPNPVYWTLLASLKNEHKELNKILHWVLGFFKQSLFIKLNVNELVWGYHDEMLKRAHALAPDWFYTDFLGYFMNKNNTDDGVYTIFTGETDINNVGVIDKYNGSSYLNFWTSDWANLINGTDGTLGPPYIDKDRTLYLFSSDICRSVSGEWTSNVKVKDITLHRYTAGYMYMANASINPANAGFCTPNTSCLDTGMLNVSTCQLLDYFHIPVAISFPHFYLGADRYQKSVEGLNPSAEQHQTYVDMEYNTGLVLSVAKRIQINLYLQPIDGFDDTSKITPVFLPILWLNETAVVNDKYADQLKKMLFTPMLAAMIVQITLLSGGALILLASVVYGIYKQNEAKKIFLKGDIKRLISVTDDDDRTC